MDINVSELAEGCMKAINAKMKNLRRLNIVVIGKSGVGKSTLVNAVFGFDMAETGIGRPVTAHMKKYTKKDFPMAIYDTKGFELGKDAQKEVKEELISKIQESIASRDINEAIHCIWYCVNASSNRFEPEEIEWIRNFEEQNRSYQIPIIIVLTQSFSKKQAWEMKKMIEAENLDVCQVLPLLAQDYEVDDNYCVKAYGADKLIEVMQEALPDELMDTLMSVQKANLSLKRKKSQTAVAAAASSAAIAGATPIPLSDAMVLVPIEVTMLASITVIFGLEISKSVLIGLVSTVVGGSGATLVGKTIVSNVLKLIPGAGTLAGGAISGTTAALVTTALGEAYIGVMTAVFNGELKTSDFETKEGRERINEIIQAQMKRNSILK